MSHASSSARGARRVLAKYVTWLRHDFASVAAAIREEIAREIPAIADLPSDHRASLAKGIDAALQMFLDAGVERRVLNDEERQTMAAVGAAGADAGVPVDAITASISVAARVVRDWPTRRQAVDIDESEAFRVFSERTTTFANAVNSAVLSAYVSRTRTTTPEHARVRFWQTVLDDALRSDADVRREAAAVGCSADTADTAWALVIVVDGLSQPLAPDTLALFPGATALSLSDASAAAQAFFVFPVEHASWPVTEASLREFARSRRATLVLVGPDGGPVDLAARYRRLAPLLPHLPALLGPRPRLVLDNDLAEVALLAAVPRPAADAFVRDVLAAVDRQPSTKSEPWLHTIEALVRQGGSPKAAANELGVDVKTVRRRMTRITQQAGIRFDTFEELCRIRTAVVLRKVAPLEGGRGS